MFITLTKSKTKNLGAFFKMFWAGPIKYGVF